MENGGGLYGQSGGLWPAVCDYYSRTWRKFEMDMHTHASAEVMYVFMGRCSVEARADGGAIKREMHTGDFVLLDARVPHRLVTDPEEMCYMLNVEFALKKSDAPFTLSALGAMSADFSRLMHQRRAAVFGNDVGGELFRALDMLISALMAEAENRALIDAHMLLFMMRLAQAVYDKRAGSSGMRHVRRAVAYIQRNFQRALTLSEIAQAAQISQGHLEKLFAREMGQTVVEYVNRIRVDRAMTLLERSALGVEHIARHVGFGSRQHFTRCFIQLTGIAPSRYRKSRERVTGRQVHTHAGMQI